jgi:anaerobic magnesium-protoporphyrin IX monomethyl ester cyclase
VVPASAATLLREEGFDIIWNDAIAEGWTFERYMAYLIQERPDMVVFETKTPVIRKHWKLIGDLKKRLPECSLVLMGDHPTALPHESMMKSDVDFVITGGHYDVVLRDLARSIRDGQPLPSGIWYRDRGRIRKTGDPVLSVDMDRLPFIDRDLTKAHLYGEKWKRRTPFFYTMAGRDCPWHRCTFCSWTTLYPRFCVKAVERHLDEIGLLIERHGAKEIFDDTGTFPGGGWLEAFCAGMMERGYHREILFSCNMRFDYLRHPRVPAMMKRAGFRKVKAGLESAKQETLDRIGKGIRLEDIVTGCKNAAREGLEVHLTVMVGYPWETRDDARRTIDLARDLMSRGFAEMLQATVVVPYPGTPLNRLAHEQDLFRFDPEDYDRYDMTEPVLKTPDMTPEEVMKMCEGVYRSFLSPGFVLRHLKTIRSLEDVSYIAKGVVAVLGHLRDFASDRGHVPPNKTGPP